MLESTDVVLCGDGGMSMLNVLKVAELGTLHQCCQQCEGDSKQRGVGREYSSIVSAEAFGNGIDMMLLKRQSVVEK